MDNFINNLYSKKVIDHFRHPRNMGVIKNADGEATIGNPVCGDVMKFYIKVSWRNGEEYLKDVRFQTLGCGAAIATSSMMTVLVKNKKLDQAKKISKKDIIEALDGLPEVKKHCSVLADLGLKKAIKDYQAQKLDMLKKSRRKL